MSMKCTACLVFAVPLDNILLSQGDRHGFYVSLGLNFCLRARPFTGLVS